MKNIMVITNETKDTGNKCTDSVLNLLKGKPCMIFRGDDINYIIKNSINIDIIIVIGGDGTMISAARRTSVLNAPLLGINLGRLGYMAELEPDEISQIEKVFTGDYTVEERMMIDVEFNFDSETKKLTALNDAVISNGVVSRMAEIELRCDGNLASRYRADGLIIATPTGSTAYSMSAGGSVIDPKLDCLCVTPVCSHSLKAKPLIFTPHSVLEVRNIHENPVDLYLTVDGSENFAVKMGETVKITRSPTVTKLISLKKYGFYNILSNKMSE